MSMHQSFNCPQEVGTYEIYRMYHEEMESLVKHIPTIRRAHSWMSFSPELPQAPGSAAERGHDPH